MKKPRGGIEKGFFEGNQEEGFQTIVLLFCCMEKFKVLLTYE
jgi:hypothetical protein